MNDQTNQNKQGRRTITLPTGYGDRTRPDGSGTSAADDLEYKIQSFNEVAASLDAQQAALRSTYDAFRNTEPTSQQLLDLHSHYMRFVDTAGRYNTAMDAVEQAVQARGMDAFQDGLNILSVSLDMEMVAGIKELLRSHGLDVTAQKKKTEPVPPPPRDTGNGPEGPGKTDVMYDPPLYKEKKKRNGGKYFLMVVLGILAGVAVSTFVIVRQDRMKAGPVPTPATWAVQPEVPAADEAPPTETPTVQPAGQPILEAAELLADVWNAPPVEAPAEQPVQEPATHVYTNEDQDVVRAIQGALSSLGYTDVRVDGDAGTITRGAIRDFQAKNGMEVNGEMTDELLLALNTALEQIQVN